MRLIDADDLLDYGMRFQFGYNKDGILLVPLCDMTNSIRNAPTVDAEPVRHGRWESYMCFDEPVTRCTACKRGFAVGYKVERFQFCPNCGAKMYGGADDD